MKLVSIYGKQYNSLYDISSKVGDVFVVKTIDGRYFKFKSADYKIFSAIEKGDESTVSAIITEKFISDVLIENNIYYVGDEAPELKPIEPKYGRHIEMVSGVVVSRLATSLSFLFCRTGYLAAILAIVINIDFLFGRWELFDYRHLVSFSFVELIAILSLMFISSLIHEFGHATACKKLTDRVGGVGIGINIFLPVFYANVSPINLLDRTGKMMVAVSGVYFQLFFSASAILLSDYAEVFGKFAVISIIALFINLIPIYRNDGYWLLNDAFAEKDIMEQTLSCILRKRPWSWLESIYSVLFITSVCILLYAYVKFLFVRGPDLIFEYIPSLDDSHVNVVRYLLVFSHYLPVFALSFFITSKIMNKGH